MRSAKKAAIFLVPVASTFILAGCSGTTNSSAHTTSTKGGSSVLTLQAQEVPSWQDNFNPFTPNNLQSPLGFIYESLFYFSTTGQQYSTLGQSYAWSPDNKTLTVSLRPNVKWSDGTAFSSADVVYTYDLLKQNPSLDTNQVWQDISNVSASNANTVVFTFKKIDVPFAQVLLSQVPIVPQHIWSSISDPSKYLDPNPVTTGPYILDKFSAQDYTLKRNPYYWGGKLAASELDFPALSSNDSSNLELVSDKLDWAGLFIPNINKVFVSKDPSNNNYWFSSTADVSLFANLSNPILGDINVRKAMSLAIDRTQIQNIGEYGYETPSNPTGLVLANSKAWVDPSLTQDQLGFSYNVNQANQILNQAGYTMGSNGVRSKNGKELEFTLIAPSGWSDWNEDQTLIAQDLAKIGIKVNVQAPTQSDWQAELTNHTFQLALESSYVDVGNTPYYGYYNSLAPTSSQNYEQFNNPQATAALEAFKTSAAQSAQQQAMYSIEHIVAQDMPVIPLVTAANWYEYTTNNFTGFPNANNPYVDASPSNAFSVEIVLQHLKRVGN